MGSGDYLVCATKPSSARPLLIGQWGKGTNALPKSDRGQNAGGVSKDLTRRKTPCESQKRRLGPKTWDRLNSKLKSTICVLFVTLVTN